MSMLDSFFNKGFKASKCKTLLKLTIPRIKLLRNRREVQIKQMRHEIAKLLETGQEATARIRVEHIIREEKMMAAQEILELFCELIAVRLPIIEAQRECPLDLKEAISSVCFAAPRCADLTELQQVQMLFASKYGKEFVAAATELRPDCGVNRKLVELLSVRAPSAETKLKLLKEIAEEHELDWDPVATETEFFKPHEDLLDGPKEFVSGSKLPLPKEKHDETSFSVPASAPNEELDSDSDCDALDFPVVPNVSLRPNHNAASTPTITARLEVSPHPETESESSKHSMFEYTSQDSHIEPENVLQERSSAKKDDIPDKVNGAKEDKHFKSFTSLPSVASESFSAKRSGSPPALPKPKTDIDVDLQDVLAAAQAAAETAERAAAAARSAASLAQVRIAELTRKNNDQVPESMSENPFHTDVPEKVSSGGEKPHLDHQNSSENYDYLTQYQSSYGTDGDHQRSELLGIPSFNKLKLGLDSPTTSEHLNGSENHQPQRLPSMDDDSYFSYPNLFTSQNPNRAGSHSFKGTSESTTRDS